MKKLIVPEGFRTGCLPRVTKIGACCSLFGEKIPVIPKADWPSIIGTVELSSLVTKIKDQNGFGSCATESTTQGVEVTRNFEGQPWVELNPLFIYHHTSGGSDRGSSIDTNLEFARDKGIAPESIWPRSKGWQAKPSAEAYEAASNYTIGEFYDVTTTEEIGSALLLGFAVVFGWQSHSCVLTELLTTSTARYANSWGNWGDKGFGTINLSSINFQYGAFAIRTTNIPDKLEPQA